MALTFRDSNGGNPLSFTQMDSNFRHFTGSFTNTGTITANAFAGDGSAITGVTAEWDGSHNGNASITGSLTTTGQISSSNSLFGTRIVASGYITAGTSITAGSNIDTPLIRNSLADTILIDDNLNITGNITSSGNISASGTIFSSTHAFDTATDSTISGDSTTVTISTGTATINTNTLTTAGIIGSGYVSGSSLISNTHITASGNISASANIYGVTGSFSHLLGASPLTIQSDNLNLDSIGNITASGNISASGDIYSSMFRGEQLFLNSGSSQYLSNPASGDAALIAMSSSGAFAANSAITPNNLVLFSEYKTGDTGTVNGKAASSILFTVNHGASNGNNAVAQIACVAQGISSNYADLVFSTRGAANNVTERMRITQDKTTVTGSLNVVGATNNNILIENSTDTTPSSNGIGNFIIQGGASGYEGYISLDATAMYIGNNSSFRDLILQTDRTTALTCNGSNQNVDVPQVFTAGTKTFKIPHPTLPEYWLYHSSIEGPKADLIYRGQINLVDGVGNVNIDSVSNMTEGTFVALTQDPQLFLQNTTGWDPLKGNISGSVLSIECRSTSRIDTVSWMVVAERDDNKIKSASITDDDGHLIPEWPISGSA